MNLTRRLDSQGEVCVRFGNRFAPAGTPKMNRRERRAATKGSKAAKSLPASMTHSALHEAALQHFRAGRLLEAQICCKEALALQAEHADTLHLMGLLSFHSKQYDHAVQWIARALRQAPKAEYLISLGNALQLLGQLEEALKAYD